MQARIPLTTTPTRLVVAPDKRLTTKHYLDVSMTAIYSYSLFLSIHVCHNNYIIMSAAFLHPCNFATFNLLERRAPLWT